jgi:tripartite-type tricarboxylate transporter receptor subunit TctC
MRVLTFAASLAIALAGATGAQAQKFPSKPITLVVGFAPGGPTDTVARVLGEHMRHTLGENAVVENKPGAAGTIGLGQVARAESDGHMLYVGNWTVNVGAVRTFPVQFDALKDFEPVALLTSSKLWIVARKDLPASNAKEFVAWLKANPGKANAASVGVGSAAHVCLVDVKNRSGGDFQIVTYRGGAPAVQAIAGGQADFGCLEGGQTLGLLRGGQVKIIGVASQTRWAGAPEVPTLTEGGLPGVDLEFWHGLWAPKNTPKPVIAKLNDAVVKAFADATVKKRLTDIGHTLPASDKMTPQALYAHHKAEIEKWWPIMEAAGIKRAQPAPALAGSNEKK